MIDFIAFLCYNDIMSTEDLQITTPTHETSSDGDRTQVWNRLPTKADIVNVMLERNIIKSDKPVHKLVAQQQISALTDKIRNSLNFAFIKKKKPVVLRDLLDTIELHNGPNSTPVNGRAIHQRMGLRHTSS